MPGTAYTPAVGRKYERAIFGLGAANGVEGGRERSGALSTQRPADPGSEQASATQALALGGARARCDLRDDRVLRAAARGARPLSLRSRGEARARAARR